MNAPTYNFAYLDEQTKRMIAARFSNDAIRGYQVPFASRGCSTLWLGDAQVTAAILGIDDTLKVIDQIG